MSEKAELLEDIVFELIDNDEDLTKLQMRSIMDGFVMSGFEIENLNKETRDYIAKHMFWPREVSTYKNIIDSGEFDGDSSAYFLKILKRHIEL